MDWIYLDNNATTRPAEEVLEAMNEIHQTLWANPSSVHRFGQMVRQRVELARTSVASLIGAKDREIIFTSGGTESNNLALRGNLLKPGPVGEHPPVLITTTVEHSAIRQPADDLVQRGVGVVKLPVDHQGLINLNDVKQALEEHTLPGREVLLSIQWANNETGAIQPVKEIAQLVADIRQQVPRGKVRFHLDATQAVGKMVVNVNAVSADLLTLAAHKFHGPKGVGVLYVRTGIRLSVQNQGGPQERERRGGTENTAGIVGMGVAADLARAFVTDEQAIARQRALRDKLEAGVLAALPASHINGPSSPDQRLWNTSNIGFAPLEAEAILLSLSEKGLCASAGAACSSGSLEPSPILLAMGVPEPVAHGSVRFSLSRYTTEQEIDQALAIIPQVVRRLAQAMPATP